jgi:hypothetical protein
MFLSISKMDNELITPIRSQMNSIYNLSPEERMRLEKHLKDCEELLMQQLLRVDATELPRKLRKQKKELVGKLQNLLAFIDTARSRIHELYSFGRILVRNSPLRSPTNYDFKSGLKLVCVDPPSEEKYACGLYLSSIEHQNHPNERNVIF